MLSRQLALIALLAVTLLAGGIRVWQARDSLWLDELHTGWCAVGSIADVLPRAAAGNQSPLFFWLEWLLVQVFGPSELTLRLPSLIAGTLLCVALSAAVVRWTGNAWLGVLAAWLVAVDPKQIYYATEARPYALVQLLAVLHVVLLVELIQRPTFGRRALFVAGAVLLFHLHYTAGLLFVGELAAYLLWRLIQHEPLAYDGKSLTLDLFFIVAFCLPAIGNLLQIYGRRTNWEAFVGQKPVTEVLNLWPAAWGAVLAILWADSFVRINEDGTQAGRESMVATSMPLAKSTSPLTPDPELPPLVVLLWELVPVGLAWLLTATDVARVLFPRYVIASAPAATLLAVLCLRMVPSRSLQAVLAIGLAAFALRSSHVIDQYQLHGRFIGDRRDDWRGAITFFSEHAEHDQYPVLVRSWLIEADGLATSHTPELAEYCLYPVTSIYPLAANRDRLVPLPRTGGGKLDAETIEQIRTSGGAWLILGGRPEITDNIAAEILLRVQGSKFKERNPEWTIAERRSFGDVRVFLVRPLPTEL
jgi:mannosyltransferase